MLCCVENYILTQDKNLSLIQNFETIFPPEENWVKKMLSVIQILLTIKITSKYGEKYEFSYDV